ncbi:MAG TPA: hypothetical protein VME92_10490 [Acetobacteraceae bacterium]|nr:hypothetical protein [Acetobacteraceae bacterium]
MRTIGAILVSGLMATPLLVSGALAQDPYAYDATQAAHVEHHQAVVTQHQATRHAEAAQWDAWTGHYAAAAQQHRAAQADRFVSHQDQGAARYDRSVAHEDRAYGYPGYGY